MSEEKIILPSSSRDKLVFRLTGIVRFEEYAKYVHVPTRNAIDEYKTIDVLIVFDNDFIKFEDSASNFSFQSLEKNLKSIRKLVYVNAPYFRRLMMDYFSSSNNCDVRFFEMDEIEEAIDCFQQPPAISLTNVS